MLSLVDSCMCPAQGLNLKPWHIGMTLQPTELPSKGLFCFVVVFFFKLINLYLRNFTCSKFLPLPYFLLSLSLNPFSFIFLFLIKTWNASRVCMSSVRRGHANLLCIVPILVYVLSKRAPGLVSQRKHS